MFKKLKRKISNNVLVHSSLGKFTSGDKQHPPRLSKGGHGEENIQELKKRKIHFNIVKQHPNGVRFGNIPTHREKRRRTGVFHTWFPKLWTRKTIKKAGEKIVNSVPYKLPKNIDLFGTFKKVKIVVKRKNGKFSTIFPYYKQRTGKRK